MLLNSLIDTGATSIVIDRTPFSRLSEDRLAIQNVPASIYRASYPMWIFSTERFHSMMKDWQIRASFDSPEGSISMLEGYMFSFSGMWYSRTL